MKVAVISPDDLSTVLFCKGIVDTLKKMDGIEPILISDVFGEDGYYKNILKTWDVKFFPVKGTRYVNPVVDLQYMNSIYRIIKKEKVDAIINNCTKQNIYGSIVGNFANVDKILCSVWGRGSLFSENNKSIKEHLVKLVLIQLYKKAFHISSKVWFTNQNDLDYFITKKLVDKRKVILTKNYVNTDDYVPCALPLEKAANLRNELHMKDGDKLVVMVGRLIWAKGVREFVEASQLLKAKMPWLKFVFVGPSENGISDAVPESYLKESEKLGNFIWTGFRKDVKDIYALADLAVLPSYYKEGGYPRALTEPMAMGKPVIAADSPDCRGPVEHGKNGYLIPIRNSHALADAITSIMSDDCKRRNFGEYSRIKAVNEFDEKVIVKQVINNFLLES